MIDIKDIIPGNSYACKFKVKTMLDDLGRPAPNLSDRPLKGTGLYEGIGVLMQRDTEKELVKLNITDLQVFNQLLTTLKRDPRKSDEYKKYLGFLQTDFNNYPSKSTTSVNLSASLLNFAKSIRLTLSGVKLPQFLTNSAGSVLGAIGYSKFASA